MSDKPETTKPTSSLVNRVIITLLSASFFAAASAGLGVWKQSALIEQRITSIDDKYIEKSSRVVIRLDALAASFGQHLTDDNAHQLTIQRQHLEFMSFMEMLEDAHKDIETNKHAIDLMQQGCCLERNR